jgi:hypothetical protein
LIAILYIREKKNISRNHPGPGQYEMTTGFGLIEKAIK